MPMKSRGRGGIIIDIFLRKEVLPMLKKDDKDIVRIFELRRGRQLAAICAALFLVLFLALLYQRPTAAGVFSKKTIYAAQVIVIAAFIGFSCLNWRCPACNKYLGGDIYRRCCRKCGVRLR